MVNFFNIAKLLSQKFSSFKIGNTLVSIGFSTDMQVTSKRPIKEALDSHDILHLRLTHD